MKYQFLGNSPIEVSELCFGTLVISPLQANLSPKEGQYLLEFAMDQGVTFFDTAELYDSYVFFHAIEASKKQRMVIASKSYAVEYDEMMGAIDDGLKRIDRDYFDVFKLHEQESPLTLKGHHGALKALIKAKEQGKIRAIGISTHSVLFCKQLLLHPEFDVIHPLFNYAGHGYLYGTVEEQEHYLKQLYTAGFGIYVMKPYGGGRFSLDFQNALQYVMSYPYKHAIAIGMKNKAEILANVALLEGKFEDSMIEALCLKEKKLFYRRALCAGCSTCINHCPSKIIHLAEDGGISIEEDKCTLCGYCLAACPNLALRLL
jgi:aryl-alcohol dehydrogenase-like predicted oxidoreductase